MNIRLHWQAELEVIEAYEYYERQRTGLGIEFALAVDEALGEVRSHPKRWANHMIGTKHYRLSRFPYGIVYKLVRPDEVVVYAVMHLHRKPGYWERRMKE